MSRLVRNLERKERIFSTKGVYKGNSRTDKLLNLGSNVGFGVRKYLYYTLPSAAYKRGRWKK